MTNKLLQIEKVSFYFLAFAFFWQLRLVWSPSGQQFNEWTLSYLYATDLLIMAILGLWGARVILLKSNLGLPLKSGFSRVISSNQNASLGIFMILSVLSLFVSQDKMLGFYRLIKLLEFVGLYFYIRYNFAALYNLKKFWQWFVAGAALQGVVAITQFFMQKSLGLKIFAESPLAPDINGVAKIVVEGEKIVRAYGLVPHPNILAAILMAALFGISYLLIDCYNSGKSKKSELPNHESRIMNQGGRQLRFSVFFRYSLFIILNSIFIAALFFTFSRSVIIIGYIFFIAWLAYIFWHNRELRKQIIFVGIFLFLVSCFLSLVYWPYVSARYDLASLSASQSLNMRVFYNQTALDFVRQSPLWGTGLGNFVPDLANMYDKLQSWVFQPVHNIYLLIAAEIGILSLLAFLAFLFFTVRGAWSRKIRFAHHGTQPPMQSLAVNNFLFIVFCFLFIGFFDHFFWDIQQGQILLWLMLGLLSSNRE